MADVCAVSLEFKYVRRVLNFNGMGVGQSEHGYTKTNVNQILINSFEILILKHTLVGWDHASASASTI